MKRLLVQDVANGLETLNIDNTNKLLDRFLSLVHLHFRWITKTCAARQLRRFLYMIYLSFFAFCFLSFAKKSESKAAHSFSSTPPSISGL